MQEGIRAAIRSRDFSKAKELIQSFPCSTNGLKLLLYASWNNAPFWVAKLLIEHGSDPNEEDTNGRTPIGYAVGHPGSLSLVKLLIDCGAHINKADKNGSIPLHFAAYWDPSPQVPRLVSFLIQEGGSIFSKDFRGRSPETIARQRNATSRVLAVLENSKVYANLIVLISSWSTMFPREVLQMIGCCLIQKGEANVLV